MNAARSLPILIPNIPAQRWSCHSCGNCCRTLVGHLAVEDKSRIDQHDWSRELGVAPYVSLGRGWALNKHADGACVFLNELNQCRIHARFGESAKPLACRIFPFSVRATARGWQATFRFDCPSATGSKGTPLIENRRWLNEVVASLRPETLTGEDSTAFRARLRATTEEVETFTQALLGWFRQSDRPMIQRLVGAVHLAAVLHGATLAKVRGPRFKELVELLIAALPAETTGAYPPATARQRGMLRQIAFVHAEHATLDEARSGVFGRMRKRWIQLRTARRLRAGTGLIPTLPGFERTSSFSDVERVQPDPAHTTAVNDLLLRYLTARIEGRSIFGAGYYGWPMFLGLGALTAAITATGWLARLRAASRGAGTFDFGDVAAAVGVVDRAATRLPALGTFAERARMEYLFHGDGLIRLLHDHPLSLEVGSFDSKGDSV